MQTKTLMELYYDLKMESLRGDPKVNFATRLIHIELMAMEFGWQCLASRASVDYRVQREAV